MGTHVKYQPIFYPDEIMINNTEEATICCRCQCISAMVEYLNKSLEELRLEDYSIGQFKSTVSYQALCSGKSSDSVVAFDHSMANNIEINGPTKYQCISAVKEYEPYSLEELRLVDYKLYKRTNSSNETLNHPQILFNPCKDQFYANVMKKFSETRNFVPLISSDQMTSYGVNKGVVCTLLQCISSMMKYENTSLEEIRCQDYFAGVKGNFHKTFAKRPILPAHPVISTQQIPIKNPFATPASLTNNYDYRLIALNDKSPEFMSIRNAVYVTAPGVKISKIEKVENETRHHQYMILKIKLEKSIPKGVMVERNLFHGTKSKNVPGICCNGFNRSLSGQNGTKFGQGSYFARDFSFSKPYGKNVVIYAKVLTGLYTQGHYWMKVAPDLNAVVGSKYDSVVDNLSDPAIFVVFSDNHAYPAYVITYV